MVLMSSTSNEWPQNQLVETDLMASTGKEVEKPGQDQPLKCPRCDSSNTKFCYYNNYSFSQPRHFCKACKRYWTRGGTLRNVPVGGGCRKNKRVKRNTPLSSSTDAASSASASAPPPEIRHASAPTHISSWFFGISSNPNSDMNPPFPSFNSRVSNVETLPTSCTSFDLKSQFNPTTQIQDMDMVTSSSFLSNISLFGSSASSNTTPITNASMASSIQQRKMVPGDLKETRTTDRFQALLPFEDLQLSRNLEDEMVMKDEKMEEGNSKWYVTCQDQIEPIGSLDQSLYWNATSFGAWPDLNNFGSSITPLI